MIVAASVASIPRRYEGLEKNASMRGALALCDPAVLLLIADAAALHPEQLNKWNNCSKEKILELRTWSRIRATKRYPPTDTKPGMLATEADLSWASKSLDDF